MQVPAAACACGQFVACPRLRCHTCSSKVPPLLVPTLYYAAKPRNPVPAGTRLQVIGLGDLGNGTVTPVLQRTELVLERLETCNEAYANWPDVDNFFEAPMICAGALHRFQTFGSSSERKCVPQGRQC